MCLANGSKTKFDVGKNWFQSCNNTFLDYDKEPLTSGAGGEFWIFTMHAVDRRGDSLPSCSLDFLNLNRSWTLVKIWCSPPSLFLEMHGNLWHDNDSSRHILRGFTNWTNSNLALAPAKNKRLVFFGWKEVSNGQINLTKSSRSQPRLQIPGGPV